MYSLRGRECDLKPRFHLVGIALVLLVLWKIHSLASPGDADPADQGTSTIVASVDADRDDTISSAPEVTADADSAAAEAANASSTDTAEAGIPVPTAITTFMGKPCPENDCSLDLAGYHWAEEHGITDPSACPEPSGEFVAGCRLYASIEQKYNI